MLAKPKKLSPTRNPPARSQTPGPVRRSRTDDPAAAAAYADDNSIDQYERSYSNDPAIVSECGQAFISAQQATGVAATAKHPDPAAHHR